ncbi:MAG: hypothetical protein LBD55_07075 [Treponema sp.]|nr:hypothetical protein [Treponema sp.]
MSAASSLKETLILSLPIRLVSRGEEPAELHREADKSSQINENAGMLCQVLIGTGKAALVFGRGADVFNRDKDYPAYYVRV